MHFWNNLVKNTSNSKKTKSKELTDDDSSTEDIAVSKEPIEEDLSIFDGIKKDDNQKNKPNLTRNKMNIQILKESVEVLKRDLDGALLACDIWAPNSAQSIVGFNPQPKATALFDKLTKFLRESLATAEFPPINEYYMLDLANNATVIILQLENGYQWGILADKSKVQLGLLLSIAIPNAKAKFNEALRG